jgi:arylsulfatase A-like enzyme
VLLVTVDTLRADRLSSTACGRPTTPRLDALAREGVLFERAYSHAPFTVPAHASLFTSLVTPSHGVETWGRRLDPAIPELFGLFREAGFRTAAFHNHPGLVASELTRHADHVEVRTFEPAEDTVGAFLDWASGSRRRFAAWVHLWDVHRPYGYRSWKAPHLRERVSRDTLELAFGETPCGPGCDPLVGRTEEFYNLNPERLARPKRTSDGMRVLEPRDLEWLEERYDNGVRAADAGVGMLVAGMESRGLLDSTLLVVTADHGESLRERPACLFAHDPFLTEQTLRVPLIVRFPGARYAGTRVADLVRGIDVLPTMLDVAGVEAPPGLQGRSLVPLARGETLPPAVLFAQTQTRHAKLRVAHASAPVLEFRQAIVSGSLELVRDRSEGTWELYDLESDPGQTQNLAGRAELFEPMRELYERTLEELPVRAGEGESSEGDRELLEAIGYGGSEDS